MIYDLRIKKIWKWLIAGVMVFLLYKFIKKDSLIYVINRSLPPWEAGLLRGILLGDKGGFEKGFYEKLKDTGLVHIVVASGTNVMLLVKGLVENLARYIGRKRIIVMALALAWGYAGLVGWEVPIVRAVLMVSVFYWAQLLGRKFNLVRALVFTVGIMLLAGGEEIITSVSFWLSVVAFAAVVCYSGVIARIPIYQGTWRSGFLMRLPRSFQSLAMTFRDDLLMTLWVSVWVTPILAMVFGKISLMAPVTNIMVLFLVETITVVGGMGTVLGIIFLPAGKLVLMLIYPLLKYCVWVIEGMGGWAASNAVLGVKFNWWMLIGWYMILIYFLIKNISK